MIWTGWWLLLLSFLFSAGRAGQREAQRRCASRLPCLALPCLALPCLALPCLGSTRSDAGTESSSLVTTAPEFAFPDCMSLSQPVLVLFLLRCPVTASLW